MVFDYIPEEKVVFHKTVPGKNISAFNHCCFVSEDYKLMSNYFDKIYRHTQGENVDLKDIEVN